MAHVYRARDSVLGRRVAVKMLTDQAMSDPRAKARFLEEARTASNLSHENIISVYDFGEDLGRPFMVMEFLEGESLRDAIKNESLVGIDRRLKVAVQVGRAIDYIHARKIVHRDIKPENVHVDLHRSGEADGLRDRQDRFDRRLHHHGRRGDDAWIDGGHSVLHGS